MFYFLSSSSNVVGYVRCTCPEEYNLSSCPTGMDCDLPCDSKYKPGTCKDGYTMTSSGICVACACGTYSSPAGVWSCMALAREFIYKSSYGGDDCDTRMKSGTISHLYIIKGKDCYCEHNRTTAPECEGGCYGDRQSHNIVGAVKSIPCMAIIFVLHH